MAVPSSLPAAVPRPQPPKPTANITIRPVRYSDHVAIAHLCAAAFVDDDLLTKTALPRAKEYPEDIYLHYLLWIRNRFWDPLNWMEVACVSTTELGRLDIPRIESEGDSIDVKRRQLNDVELVRVGEEYIVGFGSWLRLGDEGRKELSWSWYDARSLVQPLVSRLNTLHSRIYPNRALDASRGNIFGRALPYYMHFWSGRRAECWHLMQLATHPLLQGRGIGRQLGARGLERASREGICASVSSAPGKEGFYQRVCGFEDEFGDITCGEGNPLKEAGYRGGRVFWYWPEGVERPEQGK